MLGPVGCRCWDRRQKRSAPTIDETSQMRCLEDEIELGNLCVKLNKPNRNGMNGPTGDSQQSLFDYYDYY